jgi:hypothetical protein
MSEHQHEPTELRIVERNDITLVGKHTPEEMRYLMQLVKSAIPADATKPQRAKYRAAEFPTDELIEDIQRDSANNEAREKERADNPPKPDELAILVAELETKVRAAVVDYVDNCGPLKVIVQKAGE